MDSGREAGREAARSLDPTELTGHPGRGAAEEDGDRSLIRWMLSLTPVERLEVLQRHVDAVETLRGRS